MAYESQRKGPGENGNAVILTDEDEISLNEKSHLENGFSGIISDKISVNRSVPDIRHNE